MLGRENTATQQSSSRSEWYSEIRNQENEMVEAGDSYRLKFQLWRTVAYFHSRGELFYFPFINNIGL
jgi:hypothetical protein